MKTLYERFMKRIEMVPECGCWLWVGVISSYDYGILRCENRYKMAHRISWELHNGPIPNGLFVCHICDTPSCVNPHHLFLGTQKDNMQDALFKKRLVSPFGWKGEAHPFATITNQDVLNIRADKRALKEIAKEYGLSYSHISKIRTRGCWKHI